MAAAGPLAAAAIVVTAGLATPGYDPLERSISRLASPGRPGALLVDLAFAGVGVSLLALALGLRSWLLAAAATGILAVSLVSTDPGHPAATAVHRLVTLAAFGALALAPLAAARRLPGGYARLSFWMGALAVGLLVLALSLVAGGLRVGAWERCFAAVTLGWAVLMGSRLSRSGGRRRSTDPA